jgi:hypothetical protein
VLQKFYFGFAQHYRCTFLIPVVLFLVLFNVIAIFKYSANVLFFGVYMPIAFERAVFKSGDSYRVTIPMEIIRALNIKEKEKLKIWLDNSHIIIEKIST